MKLILHIGTGKTGTTSIQRTLVLNRALLRRQGVLYPKCHDQPKHCLLTVPFYPGIPREFVSKFGSNRGDIVELAQRTLGNIGQQIRKSNCHTVVLSGERFFRMNDLPAFKAAIQEYFPVFSEIRVVAYLRTPSAYFLSSFQQKIKASHTFPKLHARAYHPPLKNWQSIGPVEARLFSRDSLLNGDVVRDFLSVIDPSLPEMPRIKGNESLSAEGIYTLMTFRRLAFGDQDKQFFPQSSRLVRQISKVEAEHPDFFTKPELNTGIRDWLDQETDDLRNLKSDFAVQFPAVMQGRTLSKPDDPQKLEDLIAFDRDKCLIMHEYLLHNYAMKSNRKKDGFAEA